MLEILVNWGNPLRSIAVMLDSIAFNLIDNAYSLIFTFASGSLFKVELIQTVMNNTYVIIGIFALFRIALILVNAMINPDKLNEKGNGIGNVLINLVVMFVLLIMTPILFRELVTGYTKSDGTKEKSLQQIIVEGNYIQKIFLNSPEKGWSDDNSEPAATMRTIAASSLITIDKEVRDNPECAKDKDTKCSKAVKAYDNMVDKNDFKFSEIAKYVSYQIEVNDEDVYIYNYKMFITFAAGIAVTYLLLNFALKLALRMIELTVLEMVAPMFIATYIDPKSAKSGPFSKWLKTVGKTYASLFIDIAIISIMLLFVSLLGNSGGLSEELKGFSKIVMLFAILIFAKKAPKWISDMIGVEGTGFKGIGKTLKEDMLGGSLANKAALGATAIGAAAIGNRLANHRKEQELKKAAGLDRKNRKAKKKEIRSEGFVDKDGVSHNGKGAYSAYKKEHGLGLSQRIARNATALGNAIVGGGQAGVKGENFMSAIKGGIKASGEFVDKKALPKEGLISNIKGAVGTGFGKIGKHGYGDKNEIYDLQETQKKRQKARDWTKDGNFGEQDVGIGKGKVVVGQKDANVVLDEIAKNSEAMGGVNKSSFAAAQYALNQGYATVDNDGNIKLDNVNLSADGKSFEFKGENGKIDKVSIEALEKNVNGIMDSSSLGMVSQEQMVNTYRNNALNNYQQNEQTRSQEISSYQTAASESQKIQQAISNLTSSLGSLNVSLDASSRTSINASVENATKEIESRLRAIGNSTESDAIRERENLEALRKSILESQVMAGDGNEASAKFEQIARANLINIENINNEQSRLESTIASIDGKTNSERANTLAMEEKKITDKLNRDSTKEQ